MTLIFPQEGVNWNEIILKGKYVESLLSILNVEYSSSYHPLTVCMHVSDSVPIVIQRALIKLRVTTSQHSNISSQLQHFGTI